MIGVLSTGPPMAPPRSAEAAGKTPLTYASVFEGGINLKALNTFVLGQIFSAFPRINCASTPELNRRLQVPSGHPPVTSSVAFRDLYVEGRSLIR